MRLPKYSLTRKTFQTTTAVQLFFHGDFVPESAVAEQRPWEVRPPRPERIDQHKKDDHLLQFAVNTLAGLRKALEVDA